MTNLEEVLIRTVAEYGITAERVEGKRGIWVGNDKIAAIGVRIARWVTSHGFALNVTTNLEHFRLITPCGLHGTGVTSIAQETGRDVPLDEVREVVAANSPRSSSASIVPRAETIRLIKVMVHDGERVLLLHRRPERGNFWQPITGSIEKDELPFDAAQREVHEETGNGGGARVDEPDAVVHDRVAVPRGTLSAPDHRQRSGLHRRTRLAASDPHGRRRARRVRLVYIRGGV